jgi:hypothetical protein
MPFSLLQCDNELLKYVAVDWLMGGLRLGMSHINKGHEVLETKASSRLLVIKEYDNAL